MKIDVFVVVDDFELFFFSLLISVFLYPYFHTHRFKLFKFHNYIIHCLHFILKDSFVYFFLKVNTNLNKKLFEYVSTRSFIYYIYSCGCFLFSAFIIFTCAVCNLFICLKVLKNFFYLFTFFYFVFWERKPFKNDWSIKWTFAVKINK